MGLGGSGSMEKQETTVERGPGRLPAAACPPLGPSGSLGRLGGLLRGGGRDRTGCWGEAGALEPLQLPSDRCDLTRQPGPRPGQEWQFTSAL